MAKNLELTGVSRPALIRAAQAAVAGEFPEDPIIGRDLSRAISCIGSMVKRHGLLIQTAMADALKASDRFIVLTNVSLPLTKGAKQLLAARNPDENLARIKLAADSEADGIVKVDLVVVDPDNGWAGAYKVKRGNGATEHRKRRPIMQNLRAARLVLASYVEKLDYGPITDTTSAVIDYYGASGFDPNFTLTREKLDEHFGVPVVETVDAMTDALRDALHAELPRLFEPVFDRLTGPEPCQPATPKVGRRRSDVTGADALDALSAPPMGPARVARCAVPPRSRSSRAQHTKHQGTALWRLPPPLLEDNRTRNRAERGVIVMGTKSLIKAADSGSNPKVARRKAPRRRRTGAPSAQSGSAVPPLQWWRHLSADAYTDAHLQTLHRAISGIGMIGEPRWADAARGEPAAAVGVAIRTINDRRSLKPIVDLSMSTVLIAALNGSDAAITLLAFMIGRMAATDADSERLLRSWTEFKGAGRNPMVPGGTKSRRG